MTAAILHLTMNDFGRPLCDRSVLLVCSPLKAEALSAGLESLGASVTTFQAILVRPAADLSDLDSALASIDRYDWIIFTSAYSVEFLTQRMAELNLPLEKLAHAQVCAIGPATASKAVASGITVSLVPDEFVAEGLLKALVRRVGGLGGLKGQRILIPRAKQAREILPSELVAAGALVDVAVCYETVQAEPDAELVAKILRQPPDLIVFTSSSNVVHFTSIVGETESRRLIAESTVAAIGPITAKTVESCGKTPEILPNENSIDGLLQAIQKYFKAE